LDTGLNNSKEKKEALKVKRTQTLLGVWKYITLNNVLDPSRFQLSVPLINEIVEHYLMDVSIIKLRYNIDERIQLHKIAGLMTSLILRYRPILPLSEEFEGDRERYANEYFAILHGLSICGEYTDKDVISELTDEKWFEVWLNDFLFLLHNRNHTPESLMFIYETLSCIKFPDNIISSSSVDDECIF